MERFREVSKPVSSWPAYIGHSEGLCVMQRGGCGDCYPKGLLKFLIQIIFWRNEIIGDDLCRVFGFQVYAIRYLMAA